MKRRQFCAVSALGLGLVGYSSTPKAQGQTEQCATHPNPATFVLIPGAWHGGWCYAETARILRSRGHTVFNPSLTGLADRKHLLGPDVNMTTHILDVVNLVEAEDLTGIVLVGHSYAGQVIAGASERIPERIAAIVYIDTPFVPTDDTEYLPLIEPDAREDAQAQIDAGSYGIEPFRFLSSDTAGSPTFIASRLCRPASRSSVSP